MPVAPNFAPAPVGSRSPAPHYHGLAIALHWLLALMLTGSFCVGLYMTELPLSPARLRLYNWHKWAGITILVLSGFRLLWRLSHRPPALPPGIASAMGPWQQALYRSTHSVLYLLFFAVPLAGWAYSSAVGFPVVWFGVLPLPDWVPVDTALADAWLKPLHVGAAFTLAAVVALHVAAVLKHQIIDRDGLLARMWPARAKGKTG